MRHHLTMVQNLGNDLGIPVTNMIAQLVDTLPPTWESAWSRKSSKIRAENRIATILDLQNFLTEKIPELQDYLGWKRHLNQTSTSANIPLQWNKTVEMNSESLNVSQSSANKNDWDFKCWVDRSDDHPISKCPTAISMSGAEVFNLALSKGICSKCGREPFKHNVACTSKYPPPNCKNCPGKHYWGTICPKRLNGEIVYNDLRGRRGPRGRGGRFAGTGRSYQTTNLEATTNENNACQNNEQAAPTNQERLCNHSSTPPLTPPVLPNSNMNGMFLTRRDMNDEYEQNDVYMINELPVQIKNPINNTTFTSKRTSTKFMSAIPLKMEEKN